MTKCTDICIGQTPAKFIGNKPITLHGQSHDKPLANINLDEYLTIQRYLLSTNDNISEYIVREWVDRKSLKPAIKIN